MVKSAIVSCLVLVLCVPATPRPQGSEDSEGTRGAFLITRRKVRSKSTQPLGIGYTLFKEDTEGRAVRADPSQVFHTNDKVRILIESNTSGYLYVFHTENSGEPEMIFPDPRLNQGDNHIGAHIPYEVPSNKEANPHNRWFEFTGDPASERLYLLLTRMPLTGIPRGEALSKYSQTNLTGRAWRPSSTIWKRIHGAAVSGVRISLSPASGQTQAEVERRSVDRGLGLPLEAPVPSVVRMNLSPSASVLLTTIDLVHK